MAQHDYKVTCFSFSVCIWTLTLIEAKTWGSVTHVTLISKARQITFTHDRKWTIRIIARDRSKVDSWNDVQTWKMSLVILILSSVFLHNPWSVVNHLAKQLRRVRHLWPPRWKACVWLRVCSCWSWQQILQRWQGFVGARQDATHLSYAPGVECGLVGFPCTGSLGVKEVWCCPTHCVFCDPVILSLGLWHFASRLRLCRFHLLLSVRPVLAATTHQAQVKISCWPEMGPGSRNAASCLIFNFHPRCCVCY